MKTKSNLISLCLLGALLLPALTCIAQTNVTQIAAGGGHSLILKSDGSLWAMGDNSSGQLGLGSFVNLNIPEQIVAGGVTAIAAGGLHSLFIKSDGSLWAMGNNFYGQLGDGTTSNANQPKMIVASNVTAIAAGFVHSLFLKNDGSLWSMGDNSDGELGDGTTNNGNYYTNRPENIVAGGVTAIAAGEYDSLFIKVHTIGFTRFTELWAMGVNLYGELGDGTQVERPIPVKILSYANPGTIGTYPVIAIAAGSFHSLFLKSDGSLWGMGLLVNSTGPLQIVSSNVMSIAAGYTHLLFRKGDGSLWAMGNNFNGQLGDGTFNYTNSPEQIVSNNVTSIAAGGGFDYVNLGVRYGDGHSLFIKNDGILWAMGDDYFGELGDGGNTTVDDSNISPFGIASPELITVLPPPSPGITFYGGQPVVIFPQVSTNYLVQMTTNLASGVWVTVTNAKAINAVIITNAPGTAFFRLH